MTREMVNQIAVGAADSAAFATDGAIVLPQLLDRNAVEKLRQLVEEELDRGDDGRFGIDGDYDRLKYDLASTRELTRSVVESAHLKSALRALIPERLIATEAVGFELTGGQVGLGWHFDLISFSYIDPRSDGFSMWIPLTPIDPDGQRGGVQIVPQSVYSGRDKMLLSARHFLAGPKVIEEVGGLDVYRSQMPCSATERVILDAACVEPRLDLGDVLLFNRYVWHRSCPHLEGPIAKRLAFTIRLVAADATYDRTLCRKFGEFSIAYGNPNAQIAFGLKFDDLEDGDPMIQSRHAVAII